MNLHSYIIQRYPTALPFDGIRETLPKLFDNCYVVVIDKDSTFHGILSPNDVLERPHKLVIDSLTKKKEISIDNSIPEVLEKFRTTHCFALPVFDKNNFIGIIEKNRILYDYENIINNLHKKSMISEKAKSFFLNNLSHEIRTPLNSILGFIEILNNFQITEMENPEISLTIKKSADRFLLIMNDLIELSLINSGEKLYLSNEELSVNVLLNELEVYFEDLSKLRGTPFKLTKEIPAEELYIQTDKRRLKQILFHLIDSVLKFSPQHLAKFGYNLSKHNFIEFYVLTETLPFLDNLKAEDQLKEGSRDNLEILLEKGVGIGIPMVKSLSELMGGSVQVEVSSPEVKVMVSIPMN